MPTKKDGSWLSRLRERLRSLIRMFASSAGTPPGEAAPDSGTVHPRAYYASGGLTLVNDPSWNDSGGALDPALRLAVSLIEKKDRIQLLERTGIDASAGLVGTRYLPLHIDLRARPDAQTHQYLANHGLLVPQLYYDEAEHNDQLRSVTARLSLDQEIESGDASAVRMTLLAALGADTLETAPIIKRISLANPLQPCFIGSSLRDLNLPAHRQHGGAIVDGRDVIVGIIDDGCAFAHRDFLKPGTSRSRLLYLWDQARDPSRVGNGWTNVNVPYGCEISNVPTDPHQYLDEAIAPQVAANGAINENAVYDFLGYSITSVASHGTHVMGIATGNGQSAMGFEGVAPAADIIFVQLPAAAIEAGMSALSMMIQDAATYIFARAQALGKAAVINISYGGYSGPHDGTSPLEIHIDSLLAAPDRAVVVSAGNGLEADCHAQGRIRHGARSKALRWIVRGFDPTLNFMQIWYNQDASLDLWLTTPDGQTLQPVHLGTHQNIVLTSNAGVIVGWVDHQTDPLNNDKFIDITLRPTLADDPPLPGVAPAPPGIWLVQLENVGAQHEATFHAWIERDDGGRPGGARRRQSQFDTADSSPEYTLAGLATGLHTIIVGGYNTATQEVCRYSACGPTRATTGNPSRVKPDVCAPAEEDVAGRGVLSASSLKAQATRMNGTSASAPHVAGLIALMFQYRNFKRGGPLGADQIRYKLKAAAHAAPLKQNRHQVADQTRPIKQKDVPWSDVIGAGKIDIANSL